MEKFMQKLNIENLIVLNNIINNSNRDEILIKIAEELRVKLKTQKPADKVSVDIISKLLEDGDQARKRQDQELLRGELSTLDTADEEWQCFNSCGRWFSSPTSQLKHMDVCLSSGQNDAKSTNVHPTSTRNDFSVEASGSGNSDTAHQCDSFNMGAESDDSDCTILAPSYSETLKPAPQKNKIVPLPVYLKKVENWAANPTQKRKTLVEDVEYFRNNKRHLVFQVQLISKTFYSSKWHKEIPNKIRKGNVSHDFKRRCRDLFNKYPPQPQNDSFSSQLGQHNKFQNLNSTASPSQMPVPIKIEKIDPENITCTPNFNLQLVL
ncbi:hypothetical protein B566_EDAN007553 [Ephemera danica]|nr:hypothetical protein B566_EDAN007553 [Ephemera danica]